MKDDSPFKVKGCTKIFHHFYKGGNFCEFLFASSDDKTLQDRSILLKEILLLRET